MALTRLPMLNSEHSKEAVSERSKLKQENEALQTELQRLKNPATIEQHVDFVEEEPEPPEPEEDEPDFDPDDEPVHIDDARFARTEKKRQAETGSYGPEPFEVIEHVNGRAQIKPMLKPLSLEDLALFNKLERLRRERQAARPEPDRPRNERVTEFFRRSKPAPENEPAPQPKSWGARFAEWCTAPPRPPVWK